VSAAPGALLGNLTNQGLAREAMAEAAQSICVTGMSLGVLVDAPYVERATVMEFRLRIQSALMVVDTELTRLEQLVALEAVLRAPKQARAD